MSVHADDIMTVIRDHGWWQRTEADYNPKERVCLAMALAARFPATARRDLRNNPEWARWDTALQAAATDLFPGRARGSDWPQIDFNDHPDTTLADVELVVKEAERRLPLDDREAPVQRVLRQRVGGRATVRFMGGERGNRGPCTAGRRSARVDAGGTGPVPVPFERSEEPVRVTVTGGAGLIGSHLCRALLTAGDDVTCIDDMSSGCPLPLASLMEHPRFRFVKHDIRDPFDIGADAVFHLACTASTRAHRTDPVKILETCTTGTANVLRAAALCGRIPVLLTSTSEVYGDALAHPQREDYNGNVNPSGPRSAYEEGKRASEAMFAAWGRTGAVIPAVVRLFNTYGPGMYPAGGRAVPEFIEAALAGRPLVVNEPGTQTRSLCYVSDTVRGIRAAMDHCVPVPINIGSPQAWSMMAIAMAVLRATGSASQVVNGPPVADDPQRRCPDINRARGQLDWEPMVPLEEGLARTVEWHRKLVH